VADQTKDRHGAIRGHKVLPLGLDLAALAPYCAARFAASVRNIRRKWILELPQATLCRSHLGIGGARWGSPFLAPASPQEEQAGRTQREQRGRQKAPPGHDPGQLSRRG
jgi:hypothetical protein